MKRGIEREHPSAPLSSCICTDVYLAMCTLQSQKGTVWAHAHHPIQTEGPKAGAPGAGSAASGFWDIRLSGMGLGRLWAPQRLSRALGARGQAQGSLRAPPGWAPGTSGGPLHTQGAARAHPGLRAEPRSSPHGPGLAPGCRRCTKQSPQELGLFQPSSQHTQPRF